MFATIQQGCILSASFLLSYLSTDALIAIGVGIAAIALLGVIAAGLALHAAVMSANLILAVGVLSVLAAVFCTGIYFFGDHENDVAQDDMINATLANSLVIPGSV